MPRPQIASTQVVTDTGIGALLVGGVPGGTTGTGDQACGPITIASETPVSTTNKLQNRSGTLYWQDGILGAYVPLDVSASTYTSSAAAPNNMLTCALGTTAKNTLTALDTLVVMVSFYGTGGAAAVWLRNSTDTVDVWGTNAAGDNLGNAVNAYATTQITVRLADIAGLKRVGSVGSISTGNVIGLPLFATNWTGAWTLALRSSGTGGNITGSWSVFRVLGQ